MRKLFALLFVAGTLAFVACGEKKAEETAMDSTAMTTEEVVVDSVAAPVDSVAAPVDSVAKH